MHSVYVTVCEDLDKLKTSHMADKRSESLTLPGEEAADFKEM